MQLQNQPQVLSHEEIMQFFNSLTWSRDKAMFGLMYFCGMRTAEVLNLKYEQIGFESSKVVVFAIKKCKDRVIPIPKIFMPILNEYLRKNNINESYVFPSQMRKGKHISNKVVYKRLKKLARNFAFSRIIRPHILRHSYATKLYEDHGDILAIQHLLGHKSIMTTIIYTRVKINRLVPLVNSSFSEMCSGKEKSLYIT